MTCYTFTVCQNPNPRVDNITLREHNVDIYFNLEQLNKKYLLEINPKGQVSYRLLTQRSVSNFYLSRSIFY